MVRSGVSKGLVGVVHALENAVLDSRGSIPVLVWNGELLVGVYEFAVEFREKDRNLARIGALVAGKNVVPKGIQMENLDVLAVVRAQVYHGETLFNVVCGGGKLGEIPELAFHALVRLKVDVAVVYDARNQGSFVLTNNFGGDEARGGDIRGLGLVWVYIRVALQRRRFA